MNIKNINNTTSPIHLLKKIRSHLDVKRKNELIFVFILSIFSSLAESISIALLIPFISFFISPDTYLFNDFFVSILKYFNIEEKKNILGFVSLAFISIVLLSGFIKLRYIKSSNKLTDNITSDFRIKIFNFLINQNFKYYFTHGSNEIMSNLTQKTSSFTTIIFSSMNILNSILISSAIIFVLIINEPFYTPIIIFVVILFFYFVFKIKSKSVLAKGQRVNLNQNFIVDIFENTVGYLQEIFIYNLKNFFSSILKKASQETAKSTSEIRTISMVPKIYLETFVVVFVVIFIYSSDFSERPLANNISFLAILAFGAQKCLPLINNIYLLSINFKGATPTVLGFLRILEEDKNKFSEYVSSDELKFNSNIKMNKISFRYNEKLPEILKNINIVINKGDKILFKGQTGSGKSTMINIISGLLQPTGGKMLIDDKEINEGNIKSWQKKISIVPQTIFLNDASIQENIALGVDPDKIDFIKIKNSSKIAQIDNFIEKLPNQYQEKVGEKGVRLSGGQRQRIGIARAIYRNAEVLILDEPTNALDLKTETQVLKTISEFNKDITIIMISHSNNTISSFDKIFNLDEL